MSGNYKQLWLIIGVIILIEILPQSEMRCLDNEANILRVTDTF